LIPKSQLRGRREHHYNEDAPISEGDRVIMAIFFLKVLVVWSLISWAVALLWALIKQQQQQTPPAH
jgi:hypothetical protein